MDNDISKLSDREIEEIISELEDAYGTLLGSDAPATELHPIRTRILELQEELRKRKNSGE
jgi:hypothetical protein